MEMYLNVTDGQSNVRKFDLDETGSTFVGNGSNCRIMIQGDGVQAIHCLFWINDQKRLMIQDWNTGDTKVNGSVITEDVCLKSGDTITIGPNKIVPILASEMPEPLGHPPPDETPVQIDIQANANEMMDQDFPFEEIPIEQTVIDGSSDHFVDNAENLDGLNQATGEFVYDIDAIETDEAPVRNDFDFAASASFSNSNFESTGPLDAEEAELLRMEVEQLRFELAERDSQLTAICDQGSQDSAPSDEEQTLKLVNRLEELLQELQTSDDRVRGLEDLLRCSDQATQDEREERQQLESWVAEIEQRLIQREAESEAEMSRVVSRLEDAKAQFQAAESQLAVVLQSNQDALGESSSELIRTLGDQVTELQERLNSVSQENETLRKQVDNNQTDTKTQEALHELEQKLMKAQVESSQERANLSRQRADLQRMQDELEQKLAGTKLAQNSDVRIQAMRQHLREIHQEEQNEKEERRRNSLSGRISSLLMRSSR